MSKEQRSGKKLNPIMDEKLKARMTSRLVSSEGQEVDNSNKSTLDKGHQAVPLKKRFFSIKNYHNTFISKVAKHLSIGDGKINFRFNFGKQNDKQHLCHVNLIEKKKLDLLNNKFERTSWIKCLRNNTKLLNALHKAYLTDRIGLTYVVAAKIIDERKKREDKDYESVLKIDEFFFIRVKLLIIQDVLEREIKNIDNDSII